MEKDPSGNWLLSHVGITVAKGQCLGIRVAQMIQALHSSIPGKQKNGGFAADRFLFCEDAVMKGKERNLVEAQLSKTSFNLVLLRNIRLTYAPTERCWQ